MPAALAHAALASVCFGMFVPVVQHVFAVQSASVSHVPQVPVGIICELSEGGERGTCSRLASILFVHCPIAGL
jgi:hypothetical protein